MNKINIKCLGLLCLVANLSACATATRGTHERVLINSEPPGARAVSDIPSSSEKNVINGFIGCEPTPCGLNISRRNAPVITISKDGYQPIKFKVVSSLATSSSSVPTGTIISGLPPDSHVKAGSPDLLKRIPVGGAILTGAVLSLGGGLIIDGVSGAGFSLSPNPVTAYLSPIQDPEDMISTEN